MKLGVVVSARLGSSRLPGKALLPLAGMPSLQLLLRRLRSSAHWADCVLATTTRREDEALARLAEAEGMRAFRGHPTDLIARHLACADRFGFNRVARVTGDCPFLNGAILDEFLAAATDLPDADLVTTKPAYPVGLDVEAFSVSSMRRAAADPRLNDVDREHLTKFLYDHDVDFSIVRLASPPELAIFCGETFTLDTPEDYEKFRHWIGDASSPHFDLANLRLSPDGASA